MSGLSQAAAGTWREETLAAACPACGAEGLELVYAQDGVPVHSCRLLDTRAEAVAFPRGSLRLGFCPACGVVTNTAYEASLQDYGVAYEETQGFSPRFRKFLRELAEELIERHDVRGKELLEIGCGKGEFLVLMCELGGNRGVGIDPAFVPERIETAADVTFVRDLYSEAYGHLAGDVVICRHTLEHIHPVADFMGLVRRSLAGRRDPLVFFELPDVGRVFRDVAFWDIYYEHCTYFSPGSLARLFRRTGFEVADLRLDYDDQYILLEARPAATPAPGEPLPLEETPEQLWEDIARFRARLEEERRRWHGLVRGVRAGGGRVAVWGSGSKGVSFLTTLALGEEVVVVVDVNPHKHGKFMPVTGHEIVPPEALRDVGLDLVVAMNSIYLAEIGADLVRLGVEAKLVGA